MEEPNEELEDLLDLLGIEDDSDQRDDIHQTFNDMLNYMDDQDALATIETIIRSTKENFE